MDRKQYTVEDLLHNPNFRKWVLHPDAGTQRFWQEWQAQHPEEQALLEEARDIVLLIEKGYFSALPADTENQWQRLARSLQIGAQPVAKPVRLWLKVAATVSVVILLGLGAYWWDKKDIVSYATAYGQIETYTLPDGSTVVLNANSSLTYQQDTLHRNVWLEGEGFFEVVHTEDDKKFIVHTRGPEVEVLGTVFYVNNRESQVKVVLNSGRVAVHNEKQSMDMVPGELVAYQEETQQLNKQLTDPAIHSAWKDNLLIFDQTPLIKIAQLLKDHYGYTVTFENQTLQEVAFTGTFPADRIHVLLTTLQKSVPMTQENRRIVFGQP